MKRLTAILVAGIFLLAPLSLSAMEMMDDSSMKDVTGQAGVSIAVDDVVLYQESIADTTYWDTDGNADGTHEVSGNEYGVQISYSENTKKLITVNAITGRNGLMDSYTESSLSSEFTDLQGDPVSGIGFDITGPSALTIDVGVADTMTDALQWKSNNLGGGSLSDATMAGVIIGLPTVEITQYHSADRRTISLHTDSGDATTVNAGASFIDIEQSGTSQMAILGGTVEIAPH